MYCLLENINLLIDTKRITPFKLWIW